jgi:transposase
MTQEAKKAESRQKRRRYSLEERIKLLDEADKPGESISTVARKHGISASVLFRWRQLRESGATTGLKADEELVPASELKAGRAKIRELQRMLGKKTEEHEIVLEALEITKDRKWISRLPSLPRGGGR